MTRTKFLMVVEKPAQHRRVAILAMKRSRARRKRVTISGLYEQAMKAYLRRTKR